MKHLEVYLSAALPVTFWAGIAMIKQLSIYVLSLLPNPAELALNNYLFFEPLEWHSLESPFYTDKAVQNWNVTSQDVFSQWHHGTGKVNVNVLQGEAAVLKIMCFILWSSGL
jgi:hypothetical protein